MKRLVGWGIALLLIGCGDDRAPVDAGGGEDAAAADAGADAGFDAGPQTCLDQLEERRLALDVMGPLTQIHPSAHFDGEGLWVTYVRPEPGGGNFDVWATRRGCDGATLVEPFLVQADPAGNDIDPTIAQSGDALLIAWLTDDGTGGTDNLQIRFRMFGVDGAPRMDVDGVARTSRMGAPITDNHSGAELAPLPGGRFLLAGQRAVPELMRFSAYAQVIGADGALEGEAVEPAFEMMTTHSGAAVDVDADGARWLVYTREPDDDAEPPQVMLSALDGAPPELALEGLASSGGADVIAHAGAVHVALSGDVASQIDLHLVDVSVPLAERAARVIGLPSRVEHSPRLAASDDAVAVAYFRQIRGFTNELLVASVTDASVEPILVETDVPSYQPALTHVLGDFWFVSYAIGESPDFRLVGNFVRIP